MSSSSFETSKEIVINKTQSVVFISSTETIKSLAFKSFQSNKKLINFKSINYVQRKKISRFVAR